MWMTLHSPVWTRVGVSVYMCSGCKWHEHQQIRLRGLNEKTNQVLFRTILPRYASVPSDPRSRRRRSQSLTVARTPE
jgi:hypothetical protein